MALEYRSQIVRIGLTGAKPKRGWADMAHVPAARATPGLTLQAVATRSEATARAAAEASRRRCWFDDARAMIAHDEVDAIVVAVRRPTITLSSNRRCSPASRSIVRCRSGTRLTEAREL